MKTELTTEQSANLFKMGVPKEKATEFESFDGQDDGEFIFTLDDLWEIIESIEEDLIIRHWKEDGQDVWTGEIEDCVNSYSSSHELIDVLYEQTVCAIEQGHLKFD